MFLYYTLQTSTNFHKTGEFFTFTHNLLHLSHIFHKSPFFKPLKHNPFKDCRTRSTCSPATISHICEKKFSSISVRFSDCSPLFSNVYCHLFSIYSYFSINLGWFSINFSVNFIKDSATSLTFSRTFSETHR